MAPKQQTRYGTCPSHGQVAATREMPAPSFPFLIYAVRRFRAAKQPYSCPTCGAPVQPS